MEKSQEKEEIRLALIADIFNRIPSARYAFKFVYFLARCRAEQRLTQQTLETLEAGIKNKQKLVSLAIEFCLRLIQKRSLPKSSVNSIVLVLKEINRMLLEYGFESNQFINRTVSRYREIGESV